MRAECNRYTVKCKHSFKRDLYERERKFIIESPEPSISIVAKISNSEIMVAGHCKRLRNEDT